MPHAGCGVNTIGSTGKEVAGELYMPRRKTAALHARDLSNNHADNGTLFPNDNPSSGVVPAASSDRASARRCDTGALTPTA